MSLHRMNKANNLVNFNLTLVGQELKEFDYSSPFELCLLFKIELTLLGSIFAKSARGNISYCFSMNAS